MIEKFYLVPFKSVPGSSILHYCRLVSKKTGKCDGGIRPGLSVLVRLSGRWFGQDSFRLTKEAINFNGMHILNSFRVRCLFSNFLYTIKELKEQHQTDQKANGGKIETSIFDQVGMLTLADPSNQLHPFYCCIT